MKTVEVTVAAFDFVDNPHQALAAALDRAGVNLGCMIWLPAWAEYSREERTQFWAEALKRAGVIRWEHWDDPINFSVHFRFFLSDSDSTPIAAPP
jgi:hypothetical protein